LTSLGEEIGRGAFGVVLRANYYTKNKTDGWESKLEVAVKKPRSDVSDEELKIFLKEMRTLAHVGSHKYIVSFLGAAIDGLSKSKLTVS